MKTKKLLIAVLAVVAALSATPVWAQMAKVKGKVSDQEGKPMAGAVVELKNNESGRMYSLKADNKGDFVSIAVSPGKYDVRLLKDGQEIYRVTGFVVTTAQEQNTLDINLAAERARQQAEMSPEQKAKIEAAQKENKKIAGLNKMLTDTSAAIAAKNYPEAVRIMTEATQLDGTKYQLWAKFGEATVAYGRSLLSTDRPQALTQFQQAVTAYKKAIELKPEEATFYNNLAQAYSLLGQPQEAITQYKLAIEKNPADPRYYFNIGAVLTNMGRSDEANAAFEKAIAADPNYAEAYYQKAVNMMSKAKVDPKTGTMSAPPEVAAGFNKYLELAPTGPNAEAAKALLASIGAKVETSFGKPGARGVKVAPKKK